MDNRGVKANRNDFQVHTEPEDLQILEEAPVEDETDALIAQYASLKDHAGWQLIKKDFESTIAGYRSGRFIQSAIKSGKSVKEIGELTISGNAVADELEKIILTVETAAEQQGKKHGRLSK